jgi:spermidine synthase
MTHSFNRRALAGGLLAALGASAAPAAWGQAPSYGRVARRESQYATTYIDRDGDYVTMRFGINECLFTESRYNPSDPAELPIVYTQYMTVALAYAQRAARIVEIGLGGGRIASYLHDFLPQARVTCVELDPGVVELAQAHFGVRPGPRLELVTRDGRIYMARSREAFDIILVDAYQGTLVPFHLVTREFYTILKRRLAPGGAVAQNIAPNVLDVNRMVATARAVFQRVDLYRAGPSWVLIAHDGAAKTDAHLLARANALQQTHRLRYPLANMLPQRRANAGGGGAQPFSDDFAPVGYHDRDRRCRAGRG